MKNRAWVISVVAGSLAGCAAPYKPPTSGPTATLVIEVPGENMFGITQFTSIAGDDQCSNRAMLAVFSPIRTKPVTHVIQAESRVYLLADVGSSEFKGGNTISLRGCKQLVSFVPRQGAQYFFKQRFAGPSCQVDLVQVGEAKLPASFEAHSTKVKACD